MAGAVIGALRVTLGIDTAKFESGLSDAQRKLAGVGKKLQSAGAGIAKAGALMTVGITAPFTALASAAIPAAIESRQAAAQVEAALKSMGAVAGFTADQLAKMAGELQHTSTFDDDEILKSVTANMLTFGNVSGEAFTRAQQAAVNLSARLGQDLQSSAIQLGKALNDPIKGLTALSRVGVSFTAAQVAQVKAMVAAGDAAGAQKLILGELEKQFGGAAQAARDAAPGSDSIDAWRQFQETVGEVALNVLPPLAAAATTVLNAFNTLSPGMQTTIVAGAALAAALGPVLIGVGAITTAIGAAIPVLAAIGAALTGTAIPAIAAFTVAMAPVLLPLAAVAGAIALVVAAVRHWDEIKAVAARVVGYMTALYQGVKTWLVDKLGAVWSFVTAPIRAVGDAFRNLWDRVVGHSYIPDMVDAIGMHMRRLDGEMAQPAKAAIDTTSAAFKKLNKAAQESAKAAAKAAKGVSDAYRQLQGDLAPILDRLYPEQARFNTFQHDLQVIESAMSRMGFTAAQTADAVEKLKQEMFDEQAGGDRFAPIATPDIFGATAPVANQVLHDVEERWKKIRAANDNLKRSFTDTFQDIASAIGGFVEKFRSGDWLDKIQAVLDVVGQVLGALSQAKGGGGGGSPFAGFRAAGGPVIGGNAYVVGERGPELFSPRQSGWITSNDNLTKRQPTVVQLVVGEGQMFEPRVQGISGDVSVRTVTSAQRGAARRGRQRYA